MLQRPYAITPFVHVYESMQKKPKNFHQFCGHCAVDVAVSYMFYKAKTPWMLCYTFAFHGWLDPLMAVFFYFLDEEKEISA